MAFGAWGVKWTEVKTWKNSMTFKFSHVDEGRCKRSKIHGFLDYELLRNLWPPYKQPAPYMIRSRIVDAWRMHLARVREVLQVTSWVFPPQSFIIALSTTIFRSILDLDCPVFQRNDCQEWKVLFTSEN